MHTNTNVYAGMIKLLLFVDVFPKPVLHVHRVNATGSYFRLTVTVTVPGKYCIACQLPTLRLGLLKMDIL